MIKYTPVSSFADIEDADEYNVYNRIMSIMNASNSFSPEGDIDLVSDLVFEPTIIGEPVITPKATTDVSPDQSIKDESEGKSKLEYTPNPGEDSFRESYLKAVGEEDDMYKFFSLLAKNESGYDPTAKNPNAPAYGYFQFMQDGVRYNNISHYGDVDIDTFLNTPEIQINAARSLADSFLSHLNEEDLAKMAEKGITRSGALGGMWLGGYGGLKRYLYNNENISDKHWSPSGAGIDMETQIKRYNGIFKKGGRIEKASLGTIFSTNEPRDQRGSGVEMSSINKSSIPDISSMYYIPDKVKDIYQPSIDDLVNFIVSYEDFRPMPYQLKGQWLIGHGLSDPALIEKYRHTGIPKDVSLGEVKRLVKKILSSHESRLPGFSELPNNIKFAITDIIYNGYGDNELLAKDPKSPNLKEAIKAGDIDSIIKEMNHSKTAGGWLGIRSAARRAMALGEYMWDYKYKDSLGRHINPFKSHDKDYMTSPYVDYINM